MTPTPLNRLGTRAIVIALALSSPALAQTPASPRPDAPAKAPAPFLGPLSAQLKWEEPAEPMKVVGPIYFVGTRGLGAWLITTAEGHVLINTGMPSSGPMIEASIRKLGFRPEDLKLLLTNHAHCDHVGGLAYLRKVSGAQVAAIDAEVALLESGGKADFHYANDPSFMFEPVKVDRVFKDGETLKLGDVAITAYLTPGHTRGSTSFTLDVADGGKTYAVAIPAGTSINPGYRLVRDPSYPGIEADYRRAHAVLDKLKPDIWLYAHNEGYDYDGKRARAAREGAKAWVDSEGYRKWVATQREKLEAAVNKETGRTPPSAELLKPK